MFGKLKAILRGKKYGSALFKASAATAQNILQHLGISETPDSRMWFTFHVLAINTILFDIVGRDSPGLTTEFHAQLNDWLNASHHEVITLHKLLASKSDRSTFIEYLPLEFKSQYRDTDDKTTMNGRLAALTLFAAFYEETRQWILQSAQRNNGDMFQSFDSLMQRASDNCETPRPQWHEMAAELELYSNDTMIVADKINKAYACLLEGSFD
jgi:hypothetical protein